MIQEADLQNLDDELIDMFDDFGGEDTPGQIANIPSALADTPLLKTDTPVLGPVHASMLPSVPSFSTSRAQSRLSSVPAASTPTPVSSSPMPPFPNQYICVRCNTDNSFRRICRACGDNLVVQRDTLILRARLVAEQRRIGSALVDRAGTPQSGQYMASHAQVEVPGPAQTITSTVACVATSAESDCNSTVATAVAVNCAAPIASDGEVGVTTAVAVGSTASLAREVGVATAVAVGSTAAPAGEICVATAVAVDMGTTLIADAVIGVATAVADDSAAAPLSDNGQFAAIASSTAVKGFAVPSSMSTCSTNLSASGLDVPSGETFLEECASGSCGMCMRCRMRALAPENIPSAVVADCNVVVTASAVDTNAAPFVAEQKVQSQNEGGCAEEGQEVGRGGVAPALTAADLESASASVEQDTARQLADYAAFESKLGAIMRGDTERQRENRRKRQEARRVKDAARAERALQRAQVRAQRQAGRLWEAAVLQATQDAEAEFLAAAPKDEE